MSDPEISYISYTVCNVFLQHSFLFFPFVLLPINWFLSIGHAQALLKAMAGWSLIDVNLFVLDIIVAEYGW